MRILHVFDHSLPLQSGYVTRSLGIIRSQRTHGWQTIHVTTPRHPATAEPAEIVDGLKFYRTAKAAGSVPVLRELAEMRATRRVLARIVAAEKPDIIHAHSPVLNVLPALSVGKRFRVPVVYEVRALWEDAAVDHGTTHEGALRYRVSRMLDSWAMRRADCVAPICEPLRQDIMARGISAEKIVIVPNAVARSLLAVETSTSRDESLREQLGISSETVLGFVGSFYSYEGLDLLLRAALKLRERQVNFSVLLVGGGPDEERLKKLVEDYHLSQCVRFAGRVDHGDVARYYGLIDILVFPRKRMRLTDLVTPLKPLEAMAQSKPILASDVGGHRELICDGETGFLFAADDEAALTMRLEQLIADPELRARIARQGRQYVEEQRTWDRLMDRYAEIYERVTTRRQGGRECRTMPFTRA